MGCGNSKTEAFVGTADAEIQHYCNIIGELSGYNWEQGSAPVAKTDEALRNIIRIADENSGLQHITVDLFSSVTEAMRVENQGLYNKFSSDFNKARIAVCSKAAPIEAVDIYDMEVKGPWVPRVVTLQQGSVVPLGTSASLGISGVGSFVVGFCLEAWVRVLSKPPNKSDPAVSFLTAYGSQNAEIGANPNFILQQDGRLSMDFQSKAPLVAKKGVVEAGNWTHVAFIVGQGQMRILLNGRRVAERQSPRVWGEVALKLQAFVPVEICEYRLWNVERSDAEIAENLGTSISPRTCEDYHSLRLSWFPLPVGSDLYPPGSLCYDTWRRLSVGCRVNASPVLDSRWPCALPHLVSFTLLESNRGQLLLRHAEEVACARERTELNLHAVMVLDPALPLSPVETKAQLVAFALMMEGGPWIPRVVTLTPGVHADLGTAAELGLAVHPAAGEKMDSVREAAPATGDIWAKSYYSPHISGFTIETWVRIRAVLPGQDNCIIGYGNGAAVSNGESLYLVIREGRAVMGFLGAEFEIEADIIIPPMQWTHVAFSCDADGKQTIYANGAPIASHTSKAALSGNCALTLGGCGDGNSFLGDICELRVWNRVLSEDDIIKYMKIAIPPLAGHSHRDLRYTWLPLRRGGPVSQQMFSRVTTTFAERCDMKPEGTLSAAATQAAAAFKAEARALAAADLKFPAPTFLWDVDRRLDVGRLTHATTLLVTRTRVPPVPTLIPTAQFLPKHWSKSAVALVDDWSDCYDRMFIASWPMPPALDSHGAALTPPESAGAAVARASPWVPRALLYKQEIPLSCKVGTTAEIGIGSIGAMGRQFTLEVWVKPRSVVYPTKKLLFQDIFGHEDEVSNRGTLLFGLGRPEALRIGLANGVPFMNFAGALKSLKANDVKESGVIAPFAIPAEQWTHLSFGVDGNGVMRITIDGKTVVERNKTNALKAKGDSPVYAFGYPGREIMADVCELRVWSSYRTEDEVYNFMHMGLTPLDTGGPRVPNLRLCWFPLRSMRSVLWDTKLLRHRVCFHEISRTLGPQLSRRPHLLPPFIVNSLTTLPAAPILDDRGDAFERIFLPDLVPPVVRHKRLPGSKSDLESDVDYTAVDWDFMPFSSSMPGLPGKAKKKEKKSSGLGLAAAKTRKEKENLDIGWRDVDDGMWVQNEGFDFDDGGYQHDWGGTGSLEKELAGAELFDVSTRLSSRDSQDNFNLEAEKARKLSIGSDLGKDLASPASATTMPNSTFGSDHELLALRNNDPDISVGVIEPIKENPNAFPDAVATVAVIQKIEHSAQGKKLAPLENSPRAELDAEGNLKRARRKSKESALDIAADPDSRHTNSNTAKRRKTREPKEFKEPSESPPAELAAALQ